MPSKIIIFKDYWTIYDVESNPHLLFVFGDNNIKQGKGGQAIIRDCKNTIWIPTKKHPTNYPESFYTDSELNQNKFQIENAVNKIIALSDFYRGVVLPEDGFGTGLADLENKAPKTFDYLQKKVAFLKNSI